MGERKIIDASAKLSTVESIRADLGRLGVREGDTLLVHSSLSKIGWVCGDAEAVILALQQALGSAGTLVMPAHSGQNSDPAEWANPPVPSAWLEEIYAHMPAFDPDYTATRAMGRIAEQFRSLPGTLRSYHPQVSFAARGPHAAEITGVHALTPQFGQDSPLGALYRLDAKVLLLGVGYDSCTTFHMAETQIEDMPRKRMGAAILEDSVRTWKWFEDYAYDSDDFERLGQDFEEQGHAAVGKVGMAECRLLPVRAAVDYAASWLKKHRFA
ncbi:AAC(3) family N-acetyltransferase [Paenibacillus sp. OAE614]|uniref:aminoglycoside N(3)-acetyltransferase n=1 Tax=Paenibacillus sp. OAE614 TaxID=2663804 RepID=UPI00178B5729